MSSGNPTARKSSNKESKTASSMKHQSSETLTTSSFPVHLKNTRGLSMWLRLAFPANHLALQERKEAKTTKGTSGRKRSKRFVTFAHDSPFSKTSPVCLILATSTKSSARWPKQGSMQDGVCSELMMWVPRTDEKGSGFWPTPTVNGNYNRKGLSKTSGDGLATAVKMCKIPSASDAYTGNMKKEEFKFGNSGSLAQEVESGFLETHRKWPTPSVSDTEGGQQSDRVEQTQSGAYVLRKKNKPDSTFGAKLSDAVLFEEKKMWPTPNASDNRDRGNMSDPAIQRRIAKGKQIGLSMAVKETKGGGSLNPTWIEWLMGWPLGWTDLKPLETDKYRQWLQQHGCC